MLSSLTITITKTDSLTCQPGTYKQKAECKPCLPGTYNPYADQLQCKLCPKNTYNPIERQEQCIKAQIGGYTNLQTGATNYTHCPPGTYKEDVGFGNFPLNATACTLAPINYYTDSFGAIEPTACPKGYITTVPGSINCTVSNAGVNDASSMSPVIGAVLGGIGGGIAAIGGIIAITCCIKRLFPGSFVFKKDPRSQAKDKIFETETSAGRKDGDHDLSPKKYTFHDKPAFFDLFGDADIEMLQRHDSPLLHSFGGGYSTSLGMVGSLLPLRSSPAHQSHVTEPSFGLYNDLSYDIHSHSSRATSTISTSSHPHFDYEQSLFSALSGQSDSHIER